MENRLFQRPAKCLKLVANVPDVTVLRTGATLIRLMVRVRLTLILLHPGHRLIRLVLGVIGIVFALDLPPGI